MKRPILAVLAIILGVALCWAAPPTDKLPSLLTTPAEARMTTVVVGQGGSASAPAGQTFQEDWNCTNSDSPSCDLTWTEDAQDWDIVSNQIALATGGYEYGSLRLSTDTDTVNQYVKVTMGPSTDLAVYPSLAIRYAGTTNPFYKIFLSGYYGDMTIERCDNLAGLETCTSLSPTCSGACSECDCGTAPITFGVTITGTSTTIIRVWINPTANTPVSATEWDSGDTTPDMIATTSSSPITTQKGVALVGFAGTANQATWDNFFGGDLP